MSLVIKQTRVVEVPVQSISIAATCQQAMLIDADGQCVGSTTAMPEFMPTLLEIDLATGQIKNWTVPTGEQLQAIADAQSAAVAPTPEYTEFASGLKSALQSFVGMPVDSKQVEIEPIKPVEIDTFKPSEVVPDTVAVLEKYMPQTTNLVDVSDSKPLEIEGIKTDDSQGIVDSHFAEIEEGIVMFGGVVPEVLPAEPTPCPMPDIELDVEIIPNERFDNIEVHFDASSQKWLAEMFSQHGANHYATSTQGKFEAIKNLFKKINLQGVYEVNRIASDEVLLCDAELYGYDGSRTLNADTVYMTQGTDGAWSARMPNNRPVSAVIGIDGSLTALLKEMEGIQPEDAVIIETTDDEMRSRNKRRYAVTAKHEHAPVEASTANPVDLPSVAPTPATAEPVADPDDAVPVCTLKKSLDAADSANQIDIEDAPEPRQPARPRYRNPDDHSQTWTGRGKPPEWLQAKLDAGEQLTDYAISESAA